MEILNTRYDSFNEKKYTSILWVGITLYSIHMLISASVVYEIPILRRLFQYSGIVLIIYSLFRLLKRKNITSHFHLEQRRSCLGFYHRQRHCPLSHEVGAYGPDFVRRDRKRESPFSYRCLSDYIYRQ